MTEPLVSPTFLFRFAAPLRAVTTPWSASGASLGAEHVLPVFGELDGRIPFAEVRGGWSAQGLCFQLRVTGKRQPAWCRDTRLEDSDALHLWIDTRATFDIHRASRYCHHFVCLPLGGGRDGQQPLARLLPIARAKEQPRPIALGARKARSEPRTEGYLLQLHLPAATLTGYDPAEHPQLGFAYAVVDREKGTQTFTVGPEFVQAEDPSLWAALDLVEK